MQKEEAKKNQLNDLVRLKHGVLPRLKGLDVQIRSVDMQAKEIILADGERTYVLKADYHNFTVLQPRLQAEKKERVFTSDDASYS